MSCYACDFGGGEEFLSPPAVDRMVRAQGANPWVPRFDLHQHYLPPLVESVFSGFFHLRFIRTISFTEVNFRFGQYYAN
jgi:hypothetical protein